MLSPQKGGGRVLEYGEPAVLCYNLESWANWWERYTSVDTERESIGNRKEAELSFTGLGVVVIVVFSEKYIKIPLTNVHVLGPLGDGWEGPMTGQRKMLEGTI